MSISIASALALGEQLKELSDSWRLDAELILADSLTCQRETLYTWPEQTLTPPQQEKFKQNLKRRMQGEPIAYIIGRKSFWDFELTVTPDVLIPRPETELIVETALELFTDLKESVNIADLGTGSGAIGLALARQSPAWQITATDISKPALAVAKQNAERLQLANIAFRSGSWCEGLAHQHYDLIVSNPPYVAKNNEHLQQGDLRFEPAQALVAGQDGLADIRDIAANVTRHLKNNAWLLLEHGYDQAPAVAEILKSCGFTGIKCRQDLAGLDRMTMAMANS